MNLFQRLDREWARTLAKAPQIPSTWPPLLQQHDHLGRVVESVRRAPHPAAADRSLAALVKLAPHDDLAARTVLQALMPGLRRVAATNRWRADPADIDATAVATAWDRIRSYPLDTRPHRIAANIVFDTTKAVAKAYAHRAETPVATPIEQVADDPYDAVLDRDQIACAIRRTRRRATVSAEMTDVVVRTRMLDTPIERKAAQLGVNVAVLQKRRRRAERFIADAIRDVDTDSSIRRDHR